MNLSIFLRVAIAVVILNISYLSYAQENMERIHLNSNDRILIIAPHPDDEAIGAAGVIQRAISNNIAVHVMYLTNGDNNELSFIFHEKRIVIKKKSFLYMGDLRRKESVLAMEHLELRAEQLTFLGYPDLGTLDIFTKHWGYSKPFKSLFTRLQHVPYEKALSKNAPYIGDSILKDYKTVLMSFKPTKIFVTPPFDSNRDHQAAYLFLKLALFELKDKLPAVEVFTYLVHMSKWPTPKGLHQDLPVKPPSKLLTDHISWYSLGLSEEQVLKKKETMDFYKTQKAYNPWFLYSFVRSNELFAKTKDIPLKDFRKDTIDWGKLESEQHIIGQEIQNPKRRKKSIKNVTYAQKDGFLYIKIRTNRVLSKLFGMNIHLIGYKNHTRFSNMPKIRVAIGGSGKVVAYERLNPAQINSLKLIPSKKDMILQFPLSSLENPDYVFSSIQLNLIKLPIELTSWHTLRIEK